jgi:hypothetical protein
LQGGGRETTVQQLPYFSLVKYNNQIDAVSILEPFLFFLAMALVPGYLLHQAHARSKVVDA